MTLEPRFSYNKKWSRRVVANKETGKQKRWICRVSGLKSGRGRLINLSSGRLPERFFLITIWLKNKTVIDKVVAYGRWSLARHWSRDQSSGRAM